MKLGRSEVGLAIVIVLPSLIVVVVVAAVAVTVVVGDDVDDGSRAGSSKFMTPCTGWRPCDFSLLETRNLCTHIICPISNFRFHIAWPGDVGN